MSDAAKAATSIWDAMGQAGIGLVSLIVVAGVIVVVSFLIARLFGPIVKDWRASVETNASTVTDLRNIMSELKETTQLKAAMVKELRAALDTAAKINHKQE